MKYTQISHQNNYHSRGTFCLHRSSSLHFSSPPFFFSRSQFNARYHRFCLRLMSWKDFRCGYAERAVKIETITHATAAP